MSARYNPLHAEKRPRRKASPKPEKAPASGLTPQQRAIFSVGADLIRAIYPQRLQGTMFAHWCAQNFETSEHGYSLPALVKTSDKYAVTYSMPRAGRATIAARNLELEHVSITRREDVSLSPKDGRLRRTVQSNRYRIDVEAMIKALHEADPEHVMPVWDKIVRSLEEDHDHLIWTLNSTLNSTLNQCYSSTSSLPSASTTSTSCASSSARGAEGHDDAPQPSLSGEDLPGSPSAGVEDDLPSSPAPSPSAARPGEDRGTKDDWARDVIEFVSERAQELSRPGINPTASLITILNLLAEKHTRLVVEEAILWCIEGFAKNHPHLVFMENPGGYLTSLLASIIRDYLVARNRQAERLGEDPEKFDLAQWCEDLNEQAREAQAAAEQQTKIETENAERTKLADDAVISAMREEIEAVLAEHPELQRDSYLPVDVISISPNGDQVEGQKFRRRKPTDQRKFLPQTREEWAWRLERLRNDLDQIRTYSGADVYQIVEEDNQIASAN